MKLYSEKQQGQKEIQHVQFEKKRGARKFNTRAQACAERDKKDARCQMEQNEWCAWGQTLSSYTAQSGRGLRDFLALKKQEIKCM